MLDSLKGRFLVCDVTRYHACRIKHIVLPCHVMHACIPSHPLTHSCVHFLVCSFAKGDAKEWQVKEVKNGRLAMIAYMCKCWCLPGPQ